MTSTLMNPARVAALLLLVQSAACKKEAPLPAVMVVQASLQDGRPVTAPVDGKTLPLFAPLDEATRARVDAVLAMPAAKQAQEVAERARAYVTARTAEASETQKRRAAAPLVVVLGGPLEPPRTGMALKAEGDAPPRALPDALWISLPAEDAASDGGLEQALPGRLCAVSLALVMARSTDPLGEHGWSTVRGSPWFLEDPTSALLDGYALACEVNARRQSSSGKLDSSLTVEKAQAPWDVRAAAVTTNRYVFRVAPPVEVPAKPEDRAAALAAWAAARPPSTGSLWSGTQMAAVPGVVASVMHTWLADGDVALKPLPPAVAAHFKLPAETAAPVPAPSVAVHLKVLHAAFERLNARDTPAHPGITHWVDAVGYAFPDHRNAALRALVMTTRGRSVTHQVAAAGGMGGPSAQSLAEDVIGGAQFADGAVGHGVVQAFHGVRFKDAAGADRPWTIHVNAALPWMLAQVPALHPDDATRLAERLEKEPIVDAGGIGKHLVGVALKAFQDAAAAPAR